MQAIICATLSGPALADVVSCNMDGTPVRFAIDETQFAPAVDPKDPPRRRLTNVQMGNASFPAEPIMMGDVRGFWAEGMGGSDMMLVMQADGTAVLANSNDGLPVTGTCEVIQ